MKDAASSAKLVNSDDDKDNEDDEDEDDDEDTDKIWTRNQRQNWPA